jgi:bifunctional non-homologous end joining protein LigD
VALQTYRAKRNFAVTPEPRGGRGTRSSRAAGSQFVIQKHAARRLHYDLRLELDGVMKSWAVTRGPSLVPGEKRLAVETEDHPIEYNEFEGTIPEGEYGGGTVMIWDRGSWHPDDDPHKGFAKGNLTFTLEGNKLSGAWHLVRLRGRPGEKRKNWLLIKRHDEAARGESDPDILEEKPLSVVTGRSIPEIAGGKGRKRVWHSNRSIEDNVKAGATKQNGSTRRTGASAAAPRKRTKAAGRGSTRAPQRAASTKKVKAKKTKSKKSKLASGGAPLPAFVPPCLATLREHAPDDAGWIHEIKFDGYRIQARLDHGRVGLLTRKALDWREKFPAIAEAISQLPADQALLDGEVISETERGVSSFSQLQEDLSEGREQRLAYFGFDLLHLNGHDLTGAPLIERKQVLQELLSGTDKDSPIRYSDHFEEPGSVLLRHACQMQLEGIISKRRDAPYHSGRIGDWLKIKCHNRQEFVVTGFAPSTADRAAIGALILGYYDDGKLRYAGRVGTGYTHKMARQLMQRLQPLRRPKPPFDRLPEEETRARNAHWVAPRMVVEVAFRGWTHGDRVRQASFQGIREDKSPTEIVREKEAMPSAQRAVAAPARASAPKGHAKKTARTKSQTDAAAPYSVRLTNPDRVYWDDVGVTKQGLADYYVSVWEWISPHIVGRALALVRCPEGASSQCFFQKHASAGLDPKHLRLVKEPDGDHVITIDSLDGLISLVQAGVLEIHPRGSTADNMEMADRLIFDLDPGPGIGWDDIASAAREVRQRLKDLRLESFLKNSGGKGLHVVLPIKPAPWEEAKAFTRRIAEAMTADDPSRYTATVKKSSRQKRIFVDYLRNSREATAVAAYSTRARPGAAVSTPLTWDELRSQTSADRFTVLNINQRLARLRKDPWAEIGKIKQALPKAGR